MASKATAEAVYDALVTELEAPADERASFVRDLQYAASTQRLDRFVWGFPAAGFRVEIRGDAYGLRCWLDTWGRPDWAARLARVNEWLATMDGRGDAREFLGVSAVQSAERCPETLQIGDVVMRCGMERHEAGEHGSTFNVPAADGATAMVVVSWMIDR